MGRLIYAGSTSYEIDDRTLAHLKSVVTAKLRRHESFLVSWIIEPSAGAGRISLWVAPGIPLEFSFAESRRIALDQGWLHVLHELASTPRGLVLVGEQEAVRIAGGAPAPAV